MGQQPEDIAIINRLKGKDKDALYLLYDKYSSALFGVILRMCRNQSLAEDLLQETFVKIWQKIDMYDPNKGRFYTWAYRIAKNTTLNQIRKPDLLIQSEELGVDTNKTTPEDSPLDFAELNGAINKLEPHHKEAITLVYFKGYTHREANIAMGVPLGTFKSYIRQALQVLRESYSQALVLLWTLLNTF